MRIIKVLANKDIPADLPDDRGELKDLMTQCGFKDNVKDTESMKRRLKNASKDTYYQLKYNCGGRNSYEWTAEKVDPETMKNIVLFYTKAKAFEPLAHFFDA